MKERGMKQKECNHCWHAKEGAFMMVMRDGHIMQQCCKCGACRTVHRDHALER